MKFDTTNSQDHPFIASPNATFVLLSFPVLLSLVAEPMTGLIDTAFVSRLGPESLAALGVGTVVLSSVFWIFNFLGVGSQTEIAQASGRDEYRRAREISGMALFLGAILGVLLIAVGAPFVGAAADFMGALDDVKLQAVGYIRIRLFGAPAVLISISAFGILRGLQDMRTPLYVAIGVNGLNILLDALLIFGLGPFPALGVPGAALASVVSQWIGAAWLVLMVYRRLGLPNRIHLDDLRQLFRIGGDLFVRTGLLMVYLILATRAATRIGPEAGAAHQAIRQVWTFTAMFLDAFAITGQSLTAYFVGTGRTIHIKRVVNVVCIWSAVAGVFLGLAMLLGQPLVVRLLVPAQSVGVFTTAWLIASIFQPINALAFATDGIHWGTADYRYLRNGMIASTSCGALGIFLVDVDLPHALTYVWIATALWITVRAAFGIVRIWPGVGQSPMRLLLDT
ncbi:MAG: MATE family efflux transporter [Proteobacteria bacterium]|nr:MATE family efflux transporter [Pseudomonadota bacterium]